MSLKIEFVERAEKGEKVAPLCREFGVSRTAGHKWLKRFRELGYAGLEDESRRPKTTPLAMAEDVVLAVLEAREAHPRWGPRKLFEVLGRRFGEQTPSSRTIARILKRANKVRARRRRTAPAYWVEVAPATPATAPNDVWTVDFKGYWRARDGERCDPLTIRDACSRFVLAAELSPSTTNAVRKIFERLFRKYGLPKAIQSDNGTPFVAVNARAGLSALSAWWVSLGINLVRSRPGCPQDNGAHERMHRDMASDLEESPAQNVRSQQRAVDRWRQQFNQVRPHEALGNRVPADAFVVTERRPFRPASFDYGPHLSTRRVSCNGTIKLNREVYFVSAALRGHTVAIEHTSLTHVRVWFHDIDLGLVETLPALPEPSFDIVDLRNTRRRARKVA